MSIVRFLCAVLLLFAVLLPCLPAADLAKGVNIGDWLNTDESGHIQTTRYQKSDFEDMKSLGFDHVRIHVNFNVYEVAAPDYALSPIHYMCLDKAIMWAEELGMKVIIANTEGEIATGTADAIKDRLVMTWKNVASRYAAKGDVAAYEIFVNPGETITAEAWNGVAAALIAAIREVDTAHSIIVGPINNYSLSSMAELQKFSDSNVIYAFGFFAPALFTYQGFSLHGVAYNTINVPFPYDAAKMPTMAAGGDGAEIAEAAYINYPTEGTVAWIQSRLDMAAQFATTNNVKVYCASFGAHIGNNWDWGKSLGWRVPDVARNAYLQTVREYLESKEIPWAHVGYRGGMGVFEDYGNDPEVWMAYSNYPYDINVSACTALGLTPPEPGFYSPEPLTEGFVIFDDEVNPIARWSQWWGGEAEHSLLNADEASVGQYSMSVFYPGQYAAGQFFFPLYLDMSLLAEDGYLLDFFILSFWEDAHIQARFEDTNEDPEEKPWRMMYHVDNNVVPFDGNWQRVTVPLNEMVDMGAWDPDDRTWYGGPQGLFEWERVQCFQFVSETGAQPEAEMFMDRVRIVHPDAVDLKNEQKPRSLELAANYPNPFNPTTTIEFYLPVSVEASVRVYNVRGELVATLANEKKPAGTHTVQWDGTDGAGRQVSSGLYLYQLKIGDVEKTRRMLLIR